MGAVAKGDRNRQQARAKLAQMRALEARRRRRRLWLAVSAAVVIVAAAAVGITLAVSGGSSGSSPALKLASLSTLGPLRAAPSPGSPGPESGIPVPSAAPLATAAASASGQTVDGIIHIESPVQRTYTLGNFFDEWGQPLGPDQVGPARGHVVAIYNWQVYTGNPRNIPLTAHAQIQLQVGTPLVAPLSISWPSGL